MNAQQENFLKLVCGPALETERVWLIPAAVTVGQAIIESTAKVILRGKDAAPFASKEEWVWGASSLFRLANNPFGIKYAHRTGVEDYGGFDTETHEIVDGKLQPVEAEFQKFPGLNAAFDAHAKLFVRLPRYAPAMRVVKDWQAFASAIMHCGYSTDRPELCKIPGCVHYAAKLIRLAEENKLDDAATLHYFAGVGSEVQDAGLKPGATGHPPVSDVMSGDL